MVTLDASFRLPALCTPAVQPDIKTDLLPVGKESFRVQRRKPGFLPGSRMFKRLIHGRLAVDELLPGEHRPIDFLAKLQRDCRRHKGETGAHAV